MKRIKLVRVKCAVCRKKGFGWKEKGVQFICPRCEEIIKYNVQQRLDKER
jgi:predicted RNA-binding Zn-ribbon protein involved in translation (DUF1610 family)